MYVHRIHLSESNEPFFELIDESGQPIPIVSGFLRHLRARGYSPNTLSAYAYDLRPTALHDLSQRAAALLSGVYPSPLFGLPGVPVHTLE